MITSPQLAVYPSLRDQRVFITGGGTGIGAALVAAFAEQGAKVAFVDIAEAESDALAKRLSADGHAKPWWRACDVRDVKALQTAIQDAVADLGDFSTLVNNVARDDRHTIESVTPEYWEERMAVLQSSLSYPACVGWVVAPSSIWAQLAGRPRAANILVTPLLNHPSTG
jgi:D-xylose 1-dehydrogenase